MKTPIANRYRDRWCGSLTPADADAGEHVRVAGWVHRRRDHGGVVFIDLRDRSGIVQLVFHPDHPQAQEIAHRLRPEWVLSAQGPLLRRDPENVNPNIPTGEIELDVLNVEVLGEADTPPFAIDEDAPVDELLRLRYRPLDLRRDSMRDALILRHELVAAMRRELWERDFLEIETPMLTRSTPEGARDFLVPSRTAPGSVYALPQSPQLFKQLFMVGGLERYFQIVRCFRDEDLRADRQPEFTQLDLEMAFVVEDDVLGVMEAVMSKVFEVGKFETAPTPWPRMGYDEAMLRFGSDRPDMRFGLEIADVSDALRGSQFKVFEGVLGKGGMIRALNAGKQGAALSRSELDGLNDVVRRHGAQAVAPMPVGADGAWGSNLAKFFSAEQAAAVNAALQAQEGDLLMFVADRPSVAPTAIGALRSHLGERFELTKDAPHQVVWVMDFPMFGFNETENRWDPLHHPFTAPSMPGDPDAPLNFDDPGALRSRAYDLVVDGWELGGGSIRIHDPKVQREVLTAIGISPEEADARFGFLLEALRFGAPPHGGIAMGIDRIAAIMLGHDSIREVIAFPKTASGSDPLTGAPAPVDERQLRDLGLRAVAPPRAQQP